MRFLVGIPCLHGVDHTREAIESVVFESEHSDVDVLIIDNGADAGVKKVISAFNDTPNVSVIKNETNLFVNPAWNQIIEIGIKLEYDCIILLNSDAILPDGWSLELDKFYRMYHNDVPFPYETHDKRQAWQTQDPNADLFVEPFTGGIRGICICMTLDQAKDIYPIPDDIKVWFGDNWIYEILREQGSKTYRHHNITAYHALSQNVSIAHGVIEQIDKDKRWWEENGKTEKLKRVYENKNRRNPVSN